MSNEKSDLQALLDRAVAEAEERGRTKGAAEERHALMVKIGSIDGVMMGNGACAVLVQGRVVQATDRTLPGALRKALGLEQW